MNSWFNDVVVVDLCHECSILWSCCFESFDENGSFMV